MSSSSCFGNTPTTSKMSRKTGLWNRACRQRTSSYPPRLSFSYRLMGWTKLNGPSPGTRRTGQQRPQRGSSGHVRLKSKALLRLACHIAMSMPLRPKMKVQGLWMQSVGLMLFVADVDMAHDSSMTVEAGLKALSVTPLDFHPGQPGQVVARGIERCRLACEDRGIEMPSEVLVWVTWPASGRLFVFGVLITKLIASKSWFLVQVRAKVDNTVRENKNNACLLYLAWLVASCGFRVAGFLNARVGHTHNRLGYWMSQ